MIGARGHVRAGLIEPKPRKRLLFTAVLGPLLGIDLSASAVGGALGLTGGLATAVGGGLEGAATGALTGGALGAATGGKNIGTDILTGAVTGGAIGGLGPVIGSTLGIGTTAGDVLAGAGAGAAIDAATGSSPITGAVTGGLGGLLSGSLSSAGGSAGSPAAPAGASAITTAPPAGVNAPIDLTAPTGAADSVISGGILGPANTTNVIGNLGGGTAVLGSAPTATTGSIADAYTPSQIAQFATGTAPSTGGGILSDIGNSITDLFSPTTSGTVGPSPTANTNAIPGVNASNVNASNAIPGVNASSSSVGGGGSTNIIGQLTNAFNNNPLGVALGGGGLLYSLITGSQLQKNINTLQGEASALSAQGSQLASYLQTGTLPAGLQTEVNQATASAKAQVKSYFSGLGLSGSTMEQQALQQVDTNAITSTAQIGEQLLTTGINESALSGELLEGVIGANEKQAQATGTAIASLAAALSGRSPGVTLNLTGQPGVTALAA